MNIFTAQEKVEIAARKKRKAAVIEAEKKHLDTLDKKSQLGGANIKVVAKKVVAKKVVAKKVVAKKVAAKKVVAKSPPRP